MKVQGIYEKLYYTTSRGPERPMDLIMCKNNLVAPCMTNNVPRSAPVPITHQNPNAKVPPQLIQLPQPSQPKFQLSERQLPQLPQHQPVQQPYSFQQPQAQEPYPILHKSLEGYHPQNGQHEIQVKVSGNHVEVKSCGIPLAEADRESLKQLVKGVADRVAYNNEPVSTAGFTDTEKEICNFVARHSVKDSFESTRKDIPVKDLRHIIPMLILYCFGGKGEPSQKKVKGLWERPPLGWAPNVPYCDPNNAQRSRGEVGKPKKDILVKMFNFLIAKYWESQGMAPSISSLSLPVYDTSFPPTPSPGSEESCSLPESPCSNPFDQNSHLQPCHGQQRFSTPPHTSSTSMKPLNLSPQVSYPYTLKSRLLNYATSCTNTTTTTPSSNSAQHNEMTLNSATSDVEMTPVGESEGMSKMPAAVQIKQEPIQDWNPIQEAIDRIQAKVQYIECKRFISGGDIGILCIIRDLMWKLRTVLKNTTEQQEKFLEKLHDFECTLDVVRMTRNLPEAHRITWHEFEAKWYLKVVGISNGWTAAEDLSSQSSPAGDS